MHSIFILTSLITILLALFLLAKVHAENLGPLFKWSGYLVLLIAAAMLVYQTSLGCYRFWNRHHNNGMHHYGKMHRGMHGNSKMHMDCGGMTDHCGQMSDECMGMGHMGHMGIAGDDSLNVSVESSVDTVDGKIIVKEKKIIRKEAPAEK